ncbi:glycosyltransferase [Chromohalobacter sp. HP20-39]|uniref:glycosyltransferase n=1 Tax=Chromohalobacter sp. HP20-39 TaxID=3079306 RepID=UPI00294B5E03|nr:glycosyltransferase [Chromohalobacter sp. HP20-39]MDV6320548.1 glycosyltransferase [Chromohalobacter sp. HP20-39]
MPTKPPTLPLDVKFSVCCILPTLNSGKEIQKCLDALMKQLFHFDVFVVDSSSDDDTVDQVRRYLKDFITIRRSEFNHGGTRQMMVERLSGYDIYLFLTQDAILEDNRAIEKLVLPFMDPDIGCAYGRQLPHFDATPLARHARHFNYPELSHVRSLEDGRTLGLKAAFISNSFAAYRAKALQDIGGFPEKVILSEDMYVAASMLLKGWRVAYAADATCRHSHNYRLLEEFSRYFDIGVFHSEESWLKSAFGGVEGEGVKFVVSELKFLGVRRLYLWPRSLVANVIKYIGFFFGKHEKWLPRWFKEKISMNKKYWHYD